MYVYLLHNNGAESDVNSRQSSKRLQGLVRSRENVALSCHLKNSQWRNFPEKERNVCLTVLSTAKIIRYGVGSS